MAQRSYKTRGIVIRKTKLGETDLIITLLAEDGSKLQVVAKGARKPTSQFAARLELYSICDLHCAVGKSLDIVTEARLAPGFGTRLSVEQSLCAAPIAELLCAMAQESLSHPVLFDMSAEALRTISRSSYETGLCICAAALWKLMSVEGFRPALDNCVGCGREIDLGTQQKGIAVSAAEGGVFCGDCPAPGDFVIVDPVLLQWVKSLIYSTFSRIADEPCSSETTSALLQFARSWSRVHVGANLKSLDFVFTSGIS